MDVVTQKWGEILFIYFPQKCFPTYKWELISEAWLKGISRVCVCVCVCVCIYVYIYIVYICVYIYIYIHTHTWYVPKVIVMIFYLIIYWNYLKLQIIFFEV